MGRRSPRRRGDHTPAASPISASSSRATPPTSVGTTPRHARCRGSAESYPHRCGDDPFGCCSNRRFRSDPHISEDELTDYACPRSSHEQTPPDMGITRTAQKTYPHTCRDTRPIPTADNVVAELPPPQIGKEQPANSHHFHRREAIPACGRTRRYGPRTAKHPTRTGTAIGKRLTVHEPAPDAPRMRTKDLEPAASNLDELPPGTYGDGDPHTAMTPVKALHQLLANEGAIPTYVGTTVSPLPRWLTRSSYPHTCRDYSHQPAQDSAVVGATPTTWGR